MSGMAEDEEEGGDGDDFFEEGFDAVTLLDQMGHHQQGSSLTEQPFEVLKRAIGGETSPQAEARFSTHTFRPVHRLQHNVHLHTVGKENLWESCVPLTWPPL